MRAPIAIVASFALLLGVTACGVIPQPVPTSTSSAGALDENDDPPTEADVHGWLLEAHDNYITGSMRMCADDELMTDPDGEYAGAYAEANGGPPDSWIPGDPFDIGDGIELDFAAGTYSVYFVDGDPASGTFYEFYGTFDFEVDDDGVPISGSGTGSGRIAHPNGDMDNDMPDILEFAFSSIPEPAWCRYSYDDDGNLIED